MSGRKPHIVILGAGVIGLQTALQLLLTSALGARVTIVASHFPGDWSVSYTSPRAGAHWRSHSSDAFDQRADRETYESWLLLTAVASAEETGLARTPSYYYWEDATDETVDGFRGLHWKHYVEGFRVLEKHELPHGVVCGVNYTTFAINPVRYMLYLLERCTALGAVTVRREVDSLEQCFAEDVDVVVNCTGMGARTLAGDENVYPIKGQTVLVRNECRAVKFRKTKSGWQDAILRRPGEGTILGVSKDKDDWSDNVDPDLTEMILERCKGLAPELLVDGKFDVVQSQIGRRPARKGGIRIEIERVDVGGRGRIICHHYGHGGTGFQNSVGSANEAVCVISSALAQTKSEL